MSLSVVATTLDCRGQRCPGPILATAKAAKTIGSVGGLLEISADDDAFPFDIRAWCRSSGAELLELASDQGTFTAKVRIGSAGTPAVAPGSTHRPDSASSPEHAASSRTSSASTSSSRTLSYSDFGPWKASAHLDCRGARCPEPILRLARQARQSRPEDVIEVLSDDPAFIMDVRSWCRSSGATLLALVDEGAEIRATVRIAGLEASPSASTSESTPAPPLQAVPSPPPSPSAMDAPPDTLSLVGIPEQHRRRMLDSASEGRPQGGRLRIVVDDVNYSLELLQWGKDHHHRLLSMDARGPLIADFELVPRPKPQAAPVQSGAYPVENRCTLLVLHNDREALLAALLVGVGAAAQGMEVVMFFTFWGLNLLRGDEPNLKMPKEKVSWAQRMFKWMMPKGPKAQKLGKLNMGGLGKGMLGSIMKRYDLMDIPQLMDTAEQQGIRFVACTMSMQVMGITKRDLCARPNMEFGGVAAFVDAASHSRMSLTF